MLRRNRYSSSVEIASLKRVLDQGQVGARRCGPRYPVQAIEQDLGIDAHKPSDAHGADVRVRSRLYVPDVSVLLDQLATGTAVFRQEMATTLGMQ